MTSAQHHHDHFHHIYHHLHIIVIIIAILICSSFCDRGLESKKLLCEMIVGCSLFCSCDLVLRPGLRWVVCPQVGGSQQEHQHGARILWTQQRRAGRRRGPCNTPFVILNIVSVSLGIIA